MTDNPIGRDLDLALAEVTDAGCAHRDLAGDWTCWRKHQKASDHPVTDGYEPHEYEAPPLTLDLIAAAEEPLRKAGWVRRGEDIGGGLFAYSWWSPDENDDDDPTVRVEAPDEVTARGNAALRGLMKLKEETNVNHSA